MLVAVSRDNQFYAFVLEYYLAVVRILSAQLKHKPRRTHKSLYCLHRRSTVILIDSPHRRLSKQFLLSLAAFFDRFGFGVCEFGGGGIGSFRAWIR